MLPFEGAYCSLALRDFGGLPIIIDPEAQDGLPLPVAMTRKDWNRLGILYSRN
jgi:hypothetical protein